MYSISPFFYGSTAPFERLPSPSLTTTLLGHLFPERILNVVEQEGSNTRGNDLITGQVGVNAVAEIGGREAGVAISNDDRRVSRVELLRPSRDGGVEAGDGRGGTGAQGNDKIDL